jgi:hypothetical protein
MRSLFADFATLVRNIRRTASADDHPASFDILTTLTATATRLRTRRRNRHLA